ncbi:MAG: Mur ligase family protein, partial [Bacteroidota bacterium]|nr:Mur ligase family protein [Bacteroidota bacterium]
MKVHLIATGGSIMHNLAIALHKKGYEVTGSDDMIYEPAKSRLQHHGLLPPAGWNPENITPDINHVILGMHARPDNPELLRAQELGLPIVSFPQYIYEQSKDKKRVVVAGSHGKTTVTSMIMHVLRSMNMDFDYAVGASVAGFEDSVRLTRDAPFIIIEGDEYLSSPIDRRPKFFWYQPHIAIINGIAWDHINVFPTWEMYVEQFMKFIADMSAGAQLIFHEGDKEVEMLIERSGKHLQSIEANILGVSIEDEKTVITAGGKTFKLEIFGNHNLQNMAAALEVCRLLGILDEDFYRSIGSFTGAGKRLERVPSSRGLTVFRDFAHAPSKVAATVAAVRQQFPQQKLTAFLELHTFSSLNPEFIKGYHASLDPADLAYVYVDKGSMKAKGGTNYSEEMIRTAFGQSTIIFLEEPSTLENAVKSNLLPGTC